jgi:hypothetical protein
MGSGISLSKKQIINIIKNDLLIEFNNKQKNKDMYCNGYIIYYDFQDEIDYNNLIISIDKYTGRFWESSVKK